MSYYYSSRGRTRQPKNLAKPSGSSFADFKANGSVGLVTSSADLHERLEHSLDKCNGYDTQNQNFLHLALSQSSAAARTVNIYAYNRCFGTWGLLKVPVGGGTTVDGAYVDCSVISDNSSVKYMTIPIHGVDRVAFVCGTTTGLTLYAAGSTI